ncbi:MAG: AMP-binding protein [Nitrospirota bacterium]
MKGRTIQATLRSAALRHGEKTAFLFRGPGGWEPLTYRDFLEKARSLGAALGGFGLAPREKVALLGEARPEWCAAYLGILLSGQVAVPLDVRLTAREMRNILADSGARVLIHTNATARAADAALTDLDIRKLNVDSPLEASPRPEAPPGEDEDDEAVASLLYTSGTTGNPKAVMLTHGNLLSDAQAVMGMGIISGRDNVLAVLPLHHTYPFMCTFLVPLLLGGRITYPGSLKGAEMLRAVRETEATVLVAVPQIVEALYGRLRERLGGLPAPLAWLALRGVDLAGLLRRRWGVNLMGWFPGRLLGPRFRFLACGGARLDPGVMEGMEAMGFTVVEGYGLTETSPIVCFNPPGKRKSGSVGRAVLGAEIKILEPSGDGDGEVAVRGPMVTRGYYRRPEETRNAFLDGWFRTGDLGHMDDEGYLYISGRLKELIVLQSGKNVYPEEVEAHLLLSPLVEEACVLEKDGRLHAVVVPDMAYARHQKIGNLREVLGWEIKRLSSGLPPHMRVKGFTLSAEPLPRTPLGKLKRHLVRPATPAEGAAAPPDRDDPALTEDDLGRELLSVLKKVIPEEVPVTLSESLELDLGIDSLRKVELAESLEQRLRVRISGEAMAAVYTVEELLRLIKELRRAGPGEAPRAEAPGMGAALSGEPTEQEKREAGLLQGPLDWPVARGALALLRAFFGAFYGLRLEGRENLPEPPFIMVANHASYLDAFVAASALPPETFRRLYFQGERRFFANPLTRLFGRLAHVITINPDARLEAALRLSAHVLREGKALFVFPEGGRSFDGRLMDFKRGVGILALRLGVPVVPAWLGGTFQALPRGARRPRRARLCLRVGAPVRPGDVSLSDKPPHMDEYEYFTAKVRDAVAALAR